MQTAYDDDFVSDGDATAGGLIPPGLRRALSAAVFLVLVTAIGVWAYRLGTRDAAEVPIIRAMEGPARIQPDEPGGRTAAHQGLELNNVLTGQPAPIPRATPGSETVVTPVALTDEDGPQGELILAAPERPLDNPALGALDFTPDADAPGMVQPAPDPGGAPVASPQDLVAELLQSEAGAAPPAAAGPRPLRRPSDLRVARAPAPTATDAAPAATPAAAGAGEVASVASGSRLIQLGAFDSEDITRAAWAQMVARNGDLLGGKSLYIERTTSNARVFYRLRVAGFDSTAQTGQICEQLRSRGIDCIPVTLQ